MFSLKNMLRFFKKPKNVPVVSINPPIVNNFPRCIQTLNQCESHISLCKVNVTSILICRNYAKGKDKKKEKGKSNVY